MMGLGCLGKRPPCSCHRSCPPLLNDRYQSRPIVLSLKLPALLHKFMEPLGSALNSDTFFAKWNQLGGPPREVRQIIKAKEAVDPNTLRERVRAGVGDLLLLAPPWVCST